MRPDKVLKGQKSKKDWAINDFLAVRYELAVNPASYPEVPSWTIGHVLPVGRSKTSAGWVHVGRLAEYVFLFVLPFSCMLPIASYM